MTLSTVTAADAGVTADELVARARALAPVLRERARDCEEARRLPKESVREMTEAGLFRVLQPAAFGGYEMDFGVYLEIAYELGTGCASTAWVWENNAMHCLLVGLLPVEAQRETWVDRSADTHIATGWSIRKASAVRCDGGYVLDGHWAASSGSYNCAADLLIAPVIDADSGDVLETRLFLLFLDLGEYEIVDTWHASGLKGTGSNDVEVHTQFVPEHRTLAWTDANRFPDDGEVHLQGAGVHDSTWYWVPAADWMAWTITPALVGTAHAALDHAGERLRTRRDSLGSLLAETQAMQLRVADVGARVDLAWLSCRNDVQRCGDLHRRREVPTELQRATWRRNNAFGALLLNEAITSLRYRAGFSGNFLHDPVQRAHRDITAGTAHVGTDWEMQAQIYGRVLLDQPVIGMNF